MWVRIECDLWVADSATDLVRFSGIHEDEENAIKSEFTTMGALNVDIRPGSTILSAPTPAAVEPEVTPEPGA